LGGWKLLVQWKDKSTTWIVLNDMKESYPIQVTKYAIEARILEEPAFV
jgi:hypothetical protein